MHKSRSKYAKSRRSGLSRRQLLKVATAGAAAAGSAAVTGFPVVWAQEIKNITLTHVGGAWSAVGAIGAQASKDLGFTIKMQTAWADAQINRILTQPDSLDIADMEYWTIKKTFPSGLLQGLEIKRIKNWDKLVPLFIKGKYWDGRTVSTQGGAPYPVMYLKNKTDVKFAGEPTEWATGLPIEYNADTLGIRPDKTGQISSWSALFDPRFKGRAALMGIPAVGMMDAAMAVEGRGDLVYRDKGNMTKQEIDKTIDILIDLKKSGQFRAFWTTFDEAVNLMTSGEVVIESMWEAAVQVVRSRNMQVEYVPLKEGYRGWGNGVGLMRHLSGKKLDAAYEYLNWFLTGWHGAFQARSGYYCSYPEAARKFLEPYEWDYWYAGKPAAQDIKDPFGNVADKKGHARDGGSFEKRMSNIACWNTLMDENAHMVRRWNEFLAT
jgi:putative spermidine/putrescine transport system substrate-binding protein